MGTKQQLRWMRLPQRFMECPNLFWQAVKETWRSSTLTPEIKLIQYVDDLLLSWTEEREVKEATIGLLNFLGNQGLRVSKKKIQFVEQIWVIELVKAADSYIQEGRKPKTKKR